MSSAQIILITLIAYKIVLVVIGILARRRTRDGVDFFLGGRKLGPLIAALSASASSSSAWTLLGVSGAAYKWGLSAVWIFPACVGGFALNWFVLAPALRRHSHDTDALTVTAVLAGPPGRPLRRGIIWVASVIILFSLIVYVASQFEASGKAFSVTFNFSRSWSIIIGSGIVILYMFLGGFWAVSITDALQGLIMAMACVVLPVAAVISAGGLLDLFGAIHDLPIEGYRSFISNATQTGGLGFILGLLGIGLGYPGQPHVVNRFMALKEGEAALVHGRRIAMSWAVIVYAGMLLLGWSGRVLIEKLADNESVFIVLTNSILHPVVAGIMLAAVLSAIMSTADSQLLVAASSITSDLGLGRRSRLSLLARSRIAVVTLGILAMVTALVGRQEIFARVLFAWTAMGAAFGPLLLVTVLGKRPLAPGRTLAGMALGFTLSVIFHLVPDTAGGVIERVVPFLAVVVLICWPTRQHAAS